MKMMENRFHTLKVLFLVFLFFLWTCSFCVAFSGVYFFSFWFFSVLFFFPFFCSCSFVIVPISFFVERIFPPLVLFFSFFLLFLLSLFSHNFCSKGNYAVTEVTSITGFWDPQFINITIPAPEVSGSFQLPSKRSHIFQIR